MAKKFKGYYLVGNHSAVKLCFWLKKSLKNQGVCYKQKFYGIKSHRCLQMTPALICNQNCIYCWRPSLYKKIKKWNLPKEVFEGSLKGQRKLLEGFFGEKNINQKKLKEALEPNQVAISLIGEPTLYPYLDKLVKEYKKKGFSVFV
ncbi:4-demethylwyosine synthase TYW1, partial [bacterium]|nr:4-demethylwyosine synthase TYW1 [bacterium]